MAGRRRRTPIATSAWWWTTAHGPGLAEAAGARMVEGPFLDFLDPWGNRIEVVEYRDIQFTKAPEVLRGMALTHLGKSEKARGELAGKGMVADRPG